MDCPGRLFRNALLLTVLMMATPAQAMEIHGIFRVGYDFGGDELANLPVIDPGYAQKIRANEGALAAFGVSLLSESRNFAVDATVGWKNVERRGSIQQYSFHRTPLEVLAFFCIPSGEDNDNLVRFGVGPTVHIRPTVEESGDLAQSTLHYDDAIGVVAQMDNTVFFKRGRFGINFGIRYTSINYEGSGLPSHRAEGVGVFVGARFRFGK